MAPLNLAFMSIKFKIGPTYTKRLDRGKDLSRKYMLRGKNHILTTKSSNCRQRESKITRR